VQQDRERDHVKDLNQGNIKDIKQLEVHQNLTQSGDPDLHNKNDFKTVEYEKSNNDEISEDMNWI